MSTATPERRTAMYHAQLAMGAVMDDADGWQLPAHYGNPSQEAAWFRGTVGISDASPIGKVRIVGRDAAQALAGLVPSATGQVVGSVFDAESPLERGGRLLSVCLSPDEFLLLTPAGVAPAAIEAIRSSPPAIAPSSADTGESGIGAAPTGVTPSGTDASSLSPDSSPPATAPSSADTQGATAHALPAAPSACGHAVDVTSGLCGLAIIGPATHDLMSRITEIDTSPRALPDLTCIQSRFADVQALLLRRDVNDVPMYQLYASREFGEYLWDTLIDTAQELHGGPVGTQALLSLRPAH